MQRQNISLAFLLIFFSSVTFTGCERIEQPEASRLAKGDVKLGGTLRLSVSEVPERMDPLLMTDAASVQIGVHVYDGLIRLDPYTSELLPALAESWSMEKGGTSWVFNLRKGAVFHDDGSFGNASREVTASDVVYSLTRLATDANDKVFNATMGGRVKGATGFRLGGAGGLDGLEAIDDYTVRISLDNPDPSFLYALAQPTMGIVPEGSDRETTRELVGAGPFQLATTKDQTLLVRNANYYLGDEFGNKFPYLDTLVLVVAASNTDKLEGFFDDKIDIVTNLELDPVRSILEQHVYDFSSKAPKYIMKRETDNASYETYSIYRNGIKGLGSGFMGYRDYSRVQFEQ